MIGILVRGLVGVIVGAVVGSTVCYIILNKDTIIEKIREAFYSITEIVNATPFAAIIRRKQKNSVDVKVFFSEFEDLIDPIIREAEKHSTTLDDFFGDTSYVKSKVVTIHADEVGNDIEEGKVIILRD